MGARTIPDWPRMLRRTMAAAYVDLPVTDFERAMSAGELPFPVKIAGQERWSRAALDEALERLAGERVPDWRATNKHYAR